MTQQFTASEVRDYLSSVEERSPHRRTPMAEMTLEQARGICNKRAQQDGYWDVQKEYEQMVGAIDAAIKQREQDKEDAARYRWLLRDVGRAVDLLTGADLEGAPAYEIGDAIDPAMAKEYGNG